MLSTLGKTIGAGGSMITPAGWMAMEKPGRSSAGRDSGRPYSGTILIDSAPLYSVPSAFLAVPGAIVTATPGIVGLLRIVGAFGFTVTVWTLSTAGRVNAVGNCVMTFAV